MKRPGFTFTELLLTVAILGSAATMAVPMRGDLRRREVAAQILADVESLRSGIFRFYSDSGYFPKEAPAGEVPETLSQYLPPRYSFRRTGWTIDYQVWTSKTPSVHVKTGKQIGATVTIPDPKLGATAFEMYGNNPKFMIGSKYTFMLVGL